MRYVLLAISIVLVIVARPVSAQDDESEAMEGAEAEAQSQQQPEQPVEEPAEEAAEEEDRRVRRLGDVLGGSSEEFNIDFSDLDMPQQPVEDVPEVSLPDPERDEQLQLLLRRLAFVPSDEEAQEALETLMDEVEADIEESLDDGDLESAQRFAQVVEEVQPEREIIAEVTAAIEREASVGEALAQAEAALEAGQLIAPPGDNAAELYARVLEIEPGNEQAQSGLVETHQAVVASAIELARDDLDFEGAEERLVEAQDIREAPDMISEARENIASFRERRIESLHGEALTHIDEGRFEQADEVITDLVALGHDPERLQLLRDSLADARLYGSFEPGQIFSDELDNGRRGPTMLVVPAGNFMMGSPEDEDDRMNNEGPQHRVTFDRGFALSRTEVTVGEFAAFVSDTGYRTDAEISGGSRVYDLESGRMNEAAGTFWRQDYAGRDADDELPVIHISWRDAKAYVDWLADQTGRSYRLPSEAEFEYALRAGSQTPYWWGEGSPAENDVENVTGDRDVSPTGARWNVAFSRYSDGHWGPAPVGGLQANPFDLYDMGGNVMEWVEDCWHDSFVRAPDDGSAWVNPGCERRVIKGASWSSTPAMSRSAFRISSETSSTDMRVGFRVARDL